MACVNILGLGFIVACVPDLFHGSEEISLMLGLKSSFKRQCCAAAREVHDGKVL